ncbi:MAG: peptide chain release factor 2 [Planctomycetes bacterium]|nr:peptide chain release factor 2 [Planctomycetota bacterium]
MSELGDRYVDLGRKLANFARLVNVEAKTEEIREIEGRMGEGSFWTDQARAQQVVGTLKGMKAVVEPHRELKRAVDDAVELLAMAEADKDESSIADLRRECDRIVADYDKLELKLALSGKYDEANVFMSIKPGAGGVEACDWASMLFRMYTAYCQKAGYALEVIDMLPGEEAGLKACTLSIRGANAYGYLKSEMGTHRLVRMSPFNADGKRQTSFAAVEVTPEIDDAEIVEAIPDKDLRVDTYRASGAGGQHINKTDSAVRLTHIPTQMFVACQKERSQVQNKLTAMKMLVAKLQQLKDAERLDELKDLKGERGTIGWGHQIRSYFLQPTQLVKDLRTGYSENQAHEVLDGDLQPFIESYLRWRLGGSKDRRERDDADGDDA